MKIIPCVIGLGYVGLPIALTVSSKFLTYGFDINKERIRNLKKKIRMHNTHTIKMCSKPVNNSVLH